MKSTDRRASRSLAPDVDEPSAAPPRAPAEVTRKVYISASDSKGAPITDLTAAEITVKEGGKERTVAGLVPATAPVHVAILVEDCRHGSVPVRRVPVPPEGPRPRTVQHQRAHPAGVEARRLHRRCRGTERRARTVGPAWARGVRWRSAARGDRGRGKGAAAAEGRAARHPGAHDCRRHPSLGGAEQRAENRPIERRGPEPGLRLGRQSGAGVGRRAERIRRAHRRGWDGTGDRPGGEQNRGLPAEPGTSSPTRCRTASRWRTGSA